MKQIVGVRINKQKHIDYCEIDQQVKVNDPVVVEIKGCQFWGTVATKIKNMQDNELPKQLNKLLRIADLEDEAKMLINEKDANEAYNIAKSKIHNHQLSMKLVCADYSLDRNKLIFKFTADKRIDFRELVRDLASVFKTRIELIQIGFRDEAQYLGGIGPCGRPLCCHSFLGDFIPVSIKMAKNQDLSLNPTKISGICGRLMCCLKYEDDYYKEAKKVLPDIGTEVVTTDGMGEVIELNLLKYKVKVLLDGYEAPIEYDGNEIRIID